MCFPHETTRCLPDYERPSGASSAGCGSAALKPSIHAHGTGDRQHPDRDHVPPARGIRALASSPGAETHEGASPALAAAAQCRASCATGATPALHVLAAQLHARLPPADIIQMDSGYLVVRRRGLHPPHHLQQGEQVEGHRTACAVPPQRGNPYQPYQLPPSLPLPAVPADPGGAGWGPEQEAHYQQQLAKLRLLAALRRALQRAAQRRTAQAAARAAMMTLAGCSLASAASAAPAAAPLCHAAAAQQTSPAPAALGASSRGSLPRGLTTAQHSAWMPPQLSELAAPGSSSGSPLGDTMGPLPGGAMRPRMYS